METQHTIPSELGTVEELIRRFDKAKARRDPWIGFLTEAFRYTAPNRDTFNEREAGSNRYKDIYDMTAIVAGNHWVSRVISQVMPTRQQYVTLRPGRMYKGHPAEDELTNVLEEVTDDLFAYDKQSNFSLVLPEAMHDLKVTTGALKIDQGTLEDPFQCQAPAISTLFFEEGPRGTIENVWRKPSIEVGLLTREYDGLTLSSELKDQMANNKHTDAKANIIEGTLFEPKSGRYIGLVICRNSKTLMWSEDYGVGEGASPWIIFRGDKMPGEVMGRGPALAALPNILSANKAVELELRHMAWSSIGMWTGVSDGILNPQTARMIPGTVLPVGSNSNSNPSLRALPPAGNFNVQNLVLENLREDIKRTFLASMRRPDGPVKSATEIAIDKQEMVEDESAVFGRLQTELTDRTLKRKLRILANLGLMAKVQVDGQEVAIKHTSPISRSQDMDEVNGLTRMFEIGNATIGPEAMALGVRMEAVPEYLSRKLGVSSQLMRSEAEREQMMQGAQEALQQQQMAEQGAQAEQGGGEPPQ